MKTGLKKVFVLSISSVFLSTVLLCCCGLQHAQAASCHQSASLQGADCSARGYSSPHESCFCKSKQQIGVNADKPLLFLFLDKGISPFLAQIYIRPLTGQMIYFEFLLASDGKSPPLYLLNRVLRI